MPFCSFGVGRQLSGRVLSQIPSTWHDTPKVWRCRTKSGEQMRFLRVKFREDKRQGLRLSDTSINCQWKNFPGVSEGNRMIRENWIKLGNTATEEQDIDGAVRNSICSQRMWAQWRQFILLRALLILYTAVLLDWIMKLKWIKNEIWFWQMLNSIMPLKIINNYKKTLLEREINKSLMCVY